MNNITAMKNERPEKKKYGYSCMDYLTLIFPIPFISHIVYLIIKNIAYKKKLKRYESASTASLNELYEKGEEIRRSAQKIVDAL